MRAVAEFTHIEQILLSEGQQWNRCDIAWELWRRFDFHRWTSSTILPCSDWWFNVLHCVVDSHASSYTSSRRIDVHMNWFGTAFRLCKRLPDKSVNKRHGQQSLTCKNNNCATINELMLSLTPPIKQIMRSFKSREKISYDLSPRPVCSITIGTKPKLRVLDLLNFRTFWSII